jgi:hypothetical protein
MSENKEVKVNVEIDEEWLKYKVAEKTIEKDIEINNLKSEKEMLESTLSTIAEKELSAKCEKYGISSNLSDEQKIEKIRDAELNRSQHSTAYLTDQQISGNNDSGFDSEEDMVLALEKAKKSGNAKSAEIIGRLGKKFLEKPINLEYEGKIADLARKPIKSSLETPEQYEQKLNDFKKRQQWRNLNNYGADV